MYITWQTLITAGAVLSALGVLIALFVKAVRFFDRQKQQDDDLTQLHRQHDRDVAAIQEEQIGRAL